MYNIFSCSQLWQNTLKNPSYTLHILLFILFLVRIPLKTSYLYYRCVNFFSWLFSIGNCSRLYFSLSTTFVILTTKPRIMILTIFLQCVTKLTLYFLSAIFIFFIDRGFLYVIFLCVKHFLYFLLNISSD